MSSNKFPAAPSFLFSAPREFLVLNATDEWQALPYDGEAPLLPPNDEVLLARVADRPSSGTNSLGELIPGTLVLRDIAGPRGCPDDFSGNARGEYWSALSCIKHCLGVDPVTGETKGVIAAKGIAVLPMNPAPETVAQVRAEARARYFEFRKQWAKETVDGYAVRAHRNRAVGLEALPPPDDYDQALLILEEAKRARREKLRALGVTDSPADGLVEATPEDDADLIAFARLKAEESADKVAQESATPLDKDALVEMLMSDPKYRKLINEKYNVRKKRVRSTAH